MARPRVLLTGFGPFPGVAENPSAWLAEALAKRRPSEFGGELHARTLPTEWRIIALMPRLYEALQPHVMIHFGLSERASTLRIEHSAFNRTLSRADAIGALPEAPVIHPEGPDRIDTVLPTASLAAHLRARGLPAVVSRSAGSYLCNYLYYHSLAWAGREKKPDCRVLFVHIPYASAKGAPLSEDNLLRGAHEILRFVLTIAESQPLKTTVGPPLALGEPILGAKEA